MEQTLPEKLEEFIKAELEDAAVYRQMAQIAPGTYGRQLLLEFAEDEQNHAQEFRDIYQYITGKKYIPEIEPVQLHGTFPEMLRDRVLAESRDYQKYGREYAATTNPILRNAYEQARTDEATHALQLLYLLGEFR